MRNVIDRLKTYVEKNVKKRRKGFCDYNLDERSSI